MSIETESSADNKLTSRSASFDDGGYWRYTRLAWPQHCHHLLLSWCNISYNSSKCHLATFPWVVVPFFSPSLARSLLQQWCNCDNDISPASKLPWFVASLTRMQHTLTNLLLTQATMMQHPSSNIQPRNPSVLHHWCNKHSLANLFLPCDATSLTASTM